MDSTSSDIIETLNGELANASLAEQLGSSTHEFFVLLGSSVQPAESKMSPCVESVSKEGRRVLAKCTKHLSKMRSITQGAAFTVQKILSEDLKDGQNEENVIVLRERILATFSDVSGICGSNGMGTLEEWRTNVRDFHRNHVGPSLKETGRNVDQLMKRQKNKRIMKNDVGDVEVLKPGDPWTSLAGFLTNVPIKKFVRFASGKLGKEIIAIQKEIDNGNNEMHFLKALDVNTDLALKRLEQGVYQWNKTQRDIWDVIGVGIVRTLKRDPHMTPETREHVRHNMNMIVEELIALHHQLDKSWNAVNTVYGDVRCMTREIHAFRAAVDGISDRLEQLFSTVEIVHDTHAEAMRKRARALGASLAERLEKLRSILSEWMLRLDDGFTGTSLAMIPMVGDILAPNAIFQVQAHRLCSEMQNILQEEVSSRKSRRAVAVQKEETRVNTLLSQTSENRAATSPAALEAVCEMEKILEGISNFSTQLGMGMLFYQHESYSDQLFGSAREAVSETFPLDPYTVDEGLLIDLSHLLGREIHNLKALTKEGENSSS
ncbi:hypothetical protein AN958_10432 [Leucoagaricus sp. SymC.cos]|nr:hypothetical protein AN958_10432 [Leucoagaricus sp. SymC.cos]